MRYLYTGKQSAKLDYHAIHIASFPGLVLMEKAAQTLAKVLMERENKYVRFLFVCGTGNNGGDGIAAARLLHQNGYSVAVCMIGEEDKLSEDAKRQVAMASACQVPFVGTDAIEEPWYDIIVDGLFGVGLSRDITGVYEEIIRRINGTNKKIYAVDIPSGIHGDHGKIMNVAVRADVTVTFGVHKLGLVLYPGCEYAGEVLVGDIGYPQVSYDSIENPAYYYEPEDIGTILPKRSSRGHKGTFGKVVVIGGCEGMCGAPLLSAQAAYRCGCGLVKVVSTEANRVVVQTKLPEALFAGYDCHETAELDCEGLQEAIEYGDVVVLGPGLSQNEKAGKIVRYVLEHCEKPLILDGDGITLCDAGLLVGKKVVITPHPKEFSTLTGHSISQITENLLEESVMFARTIQGVVVGKDARTVVSDGVEQYVNVSGNSGLGTGGSGDVLTGIIAGFVAQGMSLFEAAKAGVYIHGLAGDIYAQKWNEYSLTATGIIDSLPYVLAKGKECNGYE